jgi:hypothetical protein
MLSFSISYWDLINFHYFADTTERGDRGWKQREQGVTERVTLQITPFSWVYFQSSNSKSNSNKRLISRLSHCAGSTKSVLGHVKWAPRRMWTQQKWPLCNTQYYSLPMWTTSSFIPYHSIVDFIPTLVIWVFDSLPFNSCNFVPSLVVQQS